jgi:hypothetical protein
MHKTQADFIDFISKSFGEYQFSKNNINIVCPICKKTKDDSYSKKKLAIKIDDLKSHLVHCWVCGYKSNNLIHLLKTYKSKEHLEVYLKDFFNSGLILSLDDPEEEQFFSTEESELKLPDDFQLLAPMFQNNSNNHWIVNRAFTYLKTRDLLNLRDLWYWKFGISTSETNKELWNRIIIPSFDSDGKLNYWTSRTVQKNYFPKYHNPWVDRRDIVFNEINIDWKKELFLVEGPFDLCKCPENATCVLGSELNVKYKLFQKIVENNTPIILAFDPDAVNKRARVAKLFNEYSISVRVVNIPTEFEDVGAMSKNQFIDIFNNHTLEYNRSDLIKQRIRSLTL